MNQVTLWFGGILKALCNLVCQSVTSNAQVSKLFFRGTSITVLQWHSKHCRWPASEFESILDFLGLHADSLFSHQVSSVPLSVHCPHSTERSNTLFIWLCKFFAYITTFMYLPLHSEVTYHLSSLSFITHSRYISVYIIIINNTNIHFTFYRLFFLYCIHL